MQRHFSLELAGRLDQPHFLECVRQQNHVAWYALVHDCVKLLSNFLYLAYRYYRISVLEGLQTLENLKFLNVSGNLIGRC